ncbi:MAG: mechanosensitive ion channel domain-containing protein [Pseudomonadota bacterium]
MTSNAPPADNLLLHLLERSSGTALLTQAGALAMALLLGWGLARLLRTHLPGIEGTWTAGEGGLRKKIGAPLLALAFLWLLRVLLGMWQEELHLLNLAVPLLSALVGIRLLIHALRYALKSSEALKAWERSIAWIIWLGVAMHIAGVLPRIRHALDTIAFTSGTHRFSLLTLFEALTVIVVAVTLALWASQFIESRLMRLPHMDLSLRMAFTKAARTFLLVLAVLLALPAAGIDLTVLSVFGGALGVGLGFGLQKIASNYVSGFIILLDRSIRIGDMVTVDNKYGQVSQINTRYTLLRAQDGTESIIPNETLITQTVVNHSLSKPDVRVALPIQVAYSTDLDKARDLMLEVARAHPRVIADGENPPKVLLREFAADGINLELAVWIHDPEEGQLNLRSDLYWGIWEAFRQANIEIPFPQRVVHLVNEKND